MPEFAVLLHHPVLEEIHRQFLEEFPDLEFLTPTTEAERSAALRRAKVAFGALDAAAIEQTEGLEWLQYPYAGIPAATCAALLRKNVTLTNAAGIYGVSVPEHALALMLALARRLDFSFRRQLECDWRKPTEPIMEDLCGTTVGILSTGNIGQGIARLCRAFGMQVLGMDRSETPAPYFDRIYRPDQLLEMTSRCRWLVCALPLTPQTEMLIDAKVLAAIPPGGRFVNISRGGVVDEEALIDALSSGRLLAAGLEVTAVEPLPSNSPLWKLPNVILTPHCAADPVNFSPAAARLFLRNLHTYRQKLPFERVVNLQCGF